MSIVHGACLPVFSSWLLDRMPVMVREVSAPWKVSLWSWPWLAFKPGWFCIACRRGTLPDGFSNPPRKFALTKLHNPRNFDIVWHILSCSWEILKSCTLSNSLPQMWFSIWLFVSWNLTCVYSRLCFCDRFSYSSLVCSQTSGDPDGVRTQTFPDETEDARITSHKLTDQFLIYATERGSLIYYSIEDSAVPNEYRWVLRLEAFVCSLSSILCRWMHMYWIADDAVLDKCKCAFCHIAIVCSLWFSFVCTGHIFQKMFSLAQAITPSTLSLFFLGTFFATFGIWFRHWGRCCALCGQVCIFPQRKSTQAWYVLGLRTMLRVISAVVSCVKQGLQANRIHFSHQERCCILWVQEYLVSNRLHAS